MPAPKWHDGMTARNPQDALDHVLDVLQQSAAEIDGTFARAGDSLGRGMEIFESLNASMQGLSAELAAGDMHEAAQALSDFAGELRLLSDALPAEAAMLQRISTHNTEASSYMDRLLENMRMMTVLARAARIEAAAINSAPEGFADFTSEILTFTRNAQDSIVACARQQANFFALLHSGLAAQCDFESRYRSRLISLSKELTEIFSSIQEKRENSARHTEQASAHSLKLTQAVGSAIFSLQGGDSARQRREHVSDAMRILATMTVDGDDTALAADLLCRLQAAQLEDTTDGLGRDLANIAVSLDQLSQDTERLVEFGRGLYGGTEDGGASFLDALQANLSDALILIRKCETARAPVDRVTFALGDMLEQFGTTVRALNDIIFDIVLIGINAGLKANRLGPEGRGLVVIAQELKDIAKLISDDAGQLMPIIALIQTAAEGLDRKDTQGARQIGTIDKTLRATLGQLRDSNSRLGGVLSRLIGDSVAFGEILCKAQDDISKTGETNEMVRGAAEMLHKLTMAHRQPTRADQAAHARAVVDDLVRATYTMEAERKIHDFVLGSVSPVNVRMDAA